MNIRTTLLAGVAATFLAPAFAFASMAGMPGAQMAETSAGSVLADMSGMTLYTFDKDTAAVSNCNGDCAVKWPPLMATDADRPEGLYGIIIRADGSRQWTYKGMPLYTWFKDMAAGDITGDGVKGVWHLARP